MFYSRKKITDTIQGLIKILFFNNENRLKQNSCYFENNTRTSDSKKAKRYQYIKFQKLKNDRLNSRVLVRLDKQRLNKAGLTLLRERIDE